MSSEGEVPGVNICYKAAPNENESAIYCPALPEINSLYNVLKCMGDTLSCFDINPQFYEDPLRLLINNIEGKIAQYMNAQNCDNRWWRTSFSSKFACKSLSFTHFLKTSFTTSCCSSCFHFRPWPLIL